MAASRRDLCTLDDPFADELEGPLLHASAPTDGEREVESERLLRRAQRALDELDEAEAMSALRMALRVDPANEAASLLLQGLCHTGERDRSRRSRDVTESLAEASFFARHRIFDQARAVLHDALGAFPADRRLVASLERKA